MRKLTMDELEQLHHGTQRQETPQQVVLVADNVRSMHNVGAFFRTADALGLTGIMLCGITAQPPHRDIHKTALGAELTVPWQHHAHTSQAVQQLKNEGYTILVLEQTNSSIPLQLYVPPAGPLALVVGNEVQGVQDEVLPLADAALIIPQQGAKHSLNVSVAAGIALWALCGPRVS